jgi:S-adenosylmethionine hydrolase
MRCIVLLTDFGSRDWFVGTLKGVIASLAPSARVIDLCHDIPPGDVRAGAFSLAAAYRHFPPGSVFAAVIDPGVGGPRRSLAAAAEGRFFVGPDNGVLAYALGGGFRGASAEPAGEARAGRPGPKPRVRVLENPGYRLPEVSATFHGRDIFAPAAAHLALGKPLASFGRKAEGFTGLPFPAPRPVPGGVAGEIVHLDRFGNAITSLAPRDLEGIKPEGGKTFSLRARGRVFPLAAFYAAAGAGKPVAVAGSTGFLELAVNGGNAGEKFGLRRGDSVHAF